MLNRQACFERAVETIVQQTGYSLEVNKSNGPEQGYCRYRTTNEAGALLKCAIGALIPDDRYVESCEGTPAGYVVSLLDPELGTCGPDQSDYEFLSHLQFDMHDSLARDSYKQYQRVHFDRRRYLAAARNFAQSFNLQTAFIDKLEAGSC